jgi:sensor histidine kinase YesM
VRDNGKGLAENGASHGIGLQNTRMRLEKLYGPRSSFSLTNAESKGVVARIEIPVEAPADRA